MDITLVIDDFRRLCLFFARSMNQYFEKHHRSTDVNGYLFSFASPRSNVHPVTEVEHEKKLKTMPSPSALIKFTVSRQVVEKRDLIVFAYPMIIEGTREAPLVNQRQSSSGAPL